MKRQIPGRKSVTEPAIHALIPDAALTEISARKQPLNDSLTVAPWWRILLDKLKKAQPN
ncbi:hypothetical protein PCH70_04290 [Pseudomonas cichorii JBC1]|nr:hypothetical protein PCH70_04290 [Pseudomonas cichorii JBC1]